MQTARRIAHVALHAKAQHELIARAFGAALGVKGADMAVERRVGPAAIEIDAQKAFGRMIVGQY